MPMSTQRPSNVVVISPPRPARTDPPCTTVLFVAPDRDALVAVAPVAAALERRRTVRRVVVRAEEPETAAHAELPEADRRVRVAEGDDAQRTASALVAVDSVLADERPDVVVVAGDDEVTLAAALAAAKRGISVAHLGAGARSWDWRLPEEVNRSVVDRVADSLFVVSDDGVANLESEGVPDGRIHLVGNTRIDLLRRYEANARRLAAWEAHGIAERAYVLVDLRRPATVEGDRADRLGTALADLATRVPVVLLLHPRTRAAFESGAAAAMLSAAGARCVARGGYLDDLSLLAGAGAVVTDAGPVQEESSALGIACHTLLVATAGSVTLTHGTNALLGDDPSALATVEPSPWEPTPAAIPLWDGRAGARVAETLITNYTLAASDAGEF
jgi:UDP-N-acetylglucosamine 2-epimerase (non-hydrolysing)